MYSACKLNKHSDNIQPPFPIWNQSVLPCPVLTAASWPAYRFLRRQVRCSGIPIFKNSPQFVVIHTVKGFSVVNEAEVDFFFKSLTFFMIQMFGNLIYGSSDFSKPNSTFFGISLLGIRMKTDFFQSCGHWWVFQICCHIECSTLKASSFRIWNSSTGIPCLHWLCLLWCFLRPTWLHIPGCLALGEWSQHCGYLGCEDLFCIVLLFILATPS